MSDLINALHRLERAGSEDSRATQKLRDAAYVASKEIAARMAAVPGSTELPRGYWLSPSATHLEVPDDTLPAEPQYWDYDHGYRPTYTVLTSLDEPPRHICLRLAQDLATGWLDELAEWLEKRAAEAGQASVTIATSST